MTPPPIRYPLPTLVLAVLLGMVAWWGSATLGAIVEGIQASIAWLASGPPIPNSPEPSRRAGPIVRKVLLLRDGVEATDVPSGTVVETIGQRIFADVYDRWPMEGNPTHYRIGNRRAIGWVPAEDVLPWDTRLVLLPADDRRVLREAPDALDGESVEGGTAPVPVLDWQGGAFQIVVWVPGKPWRMIERTGWVLASEIGPERLGVLVSRYELIELLRRASLPDPEISRDSRVMAVLGRLGEGAPLSAEEIVEALDALPREVQTVASDDPQAVQDRLSRMNEEWIAEVSWSGIEYHAVPLRDLLNATAP